METAWAVAVRIWNERRRQGRNPKRFSVCNQYGRGTLDPSTASGYLRHRCLLFPALQTAYAPGMSPTQMVARGRALLSLYEDLPPAGPDPEVLAFWNLAGLSPLLTLLPLHREIFFDNAVTMLPGFPAEERASVRPYLLCAYQIAACTVEWSQGKLQYRTIFSQGAIKVRDLLAQYHARLCPEKLSDDPDNQGQLRARLQELATTGEPERLLADLNFAIPGLLEFFVECCPVELQRWLLGLALTISRGWTLQQKVAPVAGARTEPQVGEIEEVAEEIPTGEAALQLKPWALLNPPLLGPQLTATDAAELGPLEGHPATQGPHALQALWALTPEARFFAAAWLPKAYDLVSPTIDAAFQPRKEASGKISTQQWPSFRTWVASRAAELRRFPLFDLLAQVAIHDPTGTSAEAVVAMKLLDDLGIPPASRETVDRVGGHTPLQLRVHAVVRSRAPGSSLDVAVRCLSQTLEPRGSSVREALLAQARGFFEPGPHGTPAILARLPLMEFLVAK